MLVWCLSACHSSVDANIQQLVEFDVFDEHLPHSCTSPSLSSAAEAICAAHPGSAPCIYRYFDCYVGALQPSPCSALDELRSAFSLVFPLLSPSCSCCARSLRTLVYVAITHCALLFSWWCIVGAWRFTCRPVDSQCFVRRRSALWCLYLFLYCTFTSYYCTLWFNFFPCCC